MSILQYCARLPDSKIPNPYRPLFRAMPSPAITSVEKKIRQLTAKSSKHGSYHKYTAKEHADIGMYALQNGVQAATQKFSEQLKIEINKSRVRLFKKQYRTKLEELCA